MIDRKSDPENGKASIEGTALAMWGYDDGSWAAFLDEDGKKQDWSMGQLLRLAGADSVGSMEYWAFESEGIKAINPRRDYDRWAYYREEWRKQNPDRKLPPLYKMKISVEIEECSEEEIKAHWEKRRALERADIDPETHEIDPEVTFD
jgi:hypothetical protein